MAHRHHVDPAELEPLASYRQRILSRIEPLAPIDAALLEARGCVLAEDVDAPADIPPFDNSGMDGFAVRAVDVIEGQPLSVIGEVAAGSSAQPQVGEGQAVRIMTGARVPPGATAVVPVELSQEQDGDVRLEVRPDEGDNVRLAGEDVRAGTRMLGRGRILGPAEIGMLASMGVARVRIHPKPRVAVIATGDELVEPGETLGPGQIFESNAYTVAAQVAESGAVAFRQTIARDDRKALTAAFKGALTQADVLVVTGGVSAGRYDLSKQVLAELGDVVFTKVGMQPGMPQAFGVIDGLPVFGLPGNPVSCAVSFEIHVRPAIRRMQGREDINRPRVTATLAEDVRSPAHKVSFLRVRLERVAHAGWQATTTGSQGSGVFSSMVHADGLAEIPADRTSMATGEAVVVHLLVAPT